MPITFQPVWQWLKFAQAFGVGPVPVQDSRVDRTARIGSPQLHPGFSPRGNSQGAARLNRVANRRWIQVAYVLVDTLLVFLNGAVAFAIRFSSTLSRDLRSGNLDNPTGTFPYAQYLAFLLLYAVLILLLCESQSLYRTLRARTAIEESLSVFKALFLATLLLTAFIYLSGIKTISRLVVGYAGLLNVATLVTWRLWKRSLVLRRAREGVGLRNTLIIGAGRIGQALAAHLEQNKLLGYKVTGFLDANHSTDPRLLGKIEDLPRIARAEFVDEVFITIPSERELVKNIAAEARRNHLNVKVIPELYDGLGWQAAIQHVGDFPVMELHWEPIPAFGLYVKRVIDVVGSGLGLIVLSPLLVVIGIVIQLDSHGPAVYRSIRVGRKGRNFVCFKFRTMIVDADDLKDSLRHMNEREGPFFKITNDPRLTRIGGFLRRYSIDELPQLWNVLRGDMSLVGPRPPVPEERAEYRPEYLRRLDVKPGVSGLWQVYGRQDASFERVLSLDLEYIENWSLWLDAKILLKTVPVALKGSGR